MVHYCQASSFPSNMYFLVLLSALLACAAGVPVNTTKPMLDGRIHGGTDTDITSHPYQVSVLQYGLYQCSGAIISENWVVTLAYCVDGSDVSPITVRSGSIYSSSGGILHSVTSIIKHENFSSDYWNYDVAVVQVSPAFTFSDSVQPITLECNSVPVGTDVVVTGWGYNPEEGDYSTTLRQVTLQIITDSECNSSYGRITESMICAADFNGDKGACGGDWGGPLVANNRLVGIYNYGWGCADPSYPDVYTKISAVCHWIVINAGLYKMSGVINWINPIPGLQTMPLTFIATYPIN